jgi:hypothetical protein
METREPREGQRRRKMKLWNTGTGQWTRIKEGEFVPEYGEAANRLAKREFGTGSLVQIGFLEEYFSPGFEFCVRVSHSVGGSPKISES